MLILDFIEKLENMPMVETTFSQLNELTGMLGKYKFNMNKVELVNENALK